MKRYPRPVTFQYLLRERINFALENDPHTGSFKAEIEASHTSKE